MSSLTKQTISTMFLDLTYKKPIDKITVKDVVEKCNITRQTFYYHFSDLLDMFEWSLEQKMEEILIKSLQVDSVKESIKILLLIVEEYPELVNKLLNSQHRAYAEKLLFNTMNDYLKKMVDKKELFMEMNRFDLDLTLRFYSHAIGGIMVEICQERDEVDLDKISGQISQILTGEIFE